MKQSLRGALAYLLATAVFLIILIASGVFDPKPLGERQTSLPEISLIVSKPGQTIMWLDETLPVGDFSVRGTAVHQSGSLDSGVGLALGDENNQFIVAVSPLGYVLVQHDDTAVLPWQPWPHVQLEDKPNEIWIDVQGEEITVRLNRELLWQGTYSLPTRNLGIFGESFGGTAVYTVSTLEIFSP
jgi:hypothetical protein